MTVILLVALPLALGFLLLIGAEKHVVTRSLLLLGAWSHAFLTMQAWQYMGTEATVVEYGETLLLNLDQTGALILAITSLLFNLVALHTVFWLTPEETLEGAHGKTVMKEKYFCGLLLLFLGTMSLVTLAGNFALIWVAVEATTLASAPLIAFSRSEYSLEAMWKYLLICSVGIALALFGTMLVEHAAQLAEGGGGAWNYEMHWFKAGFIFILAGYGTKMGLAPFHTWLPDAHSEAPATVSALLSGALLNCSWLGIYRFYTAAPEPLKEFCNQLLIALGILSLAVAAFFIIHQRDFKRMLAYSSVEHMGLAALMLGVAGSSLTLTHLAGHSLIKMALFLVAGNTLLAFGTRAVARVSGVGEGMPKTALLWIVGMLMICGTPLSPLFVTELLLIGRISNPLLALTVLVLLGIVFAGMAKIVLKMVLGSAFPLDRKSLGVRAAEHLWVIPAAALFAALIYGVVLAIVAVRMGGTF